MPKRAFFSSISQSWDTEHSGNEEQEHLRIFARHFHLQPGEHILDAGCGSGRLIPLICEQIGGQGSLVELDFAPGMLEIGRRKAYGGNVTFMAGDAHALPFPEKVFDKVIALALLPHLDDKAVVLKEFRRVLKPGGWLVIAHQLGRDALNRLHGRCAAAVRYDLLPENHVLHDWLAEAGFSAIDILDEADQYVAWGRA
jgi:demethylmenaquinone methyltransferase/2-methoxy-6-polyprenyl-1,4-benzoquinol methylase